MVSVDVCMVCDWKSKSIKMHYTNETDIIHHFCISLCIIFK